MTNQLKMKKCRRRECKKDYQPAVEWQKYCSDACRDAISNKKRAKKIREMKKFFESHSESAA